MQNLSSNLIMVIVSGMAYAFVHETGHFLVAFLLGLNPKFVYTSATSNLLNLALGVEYMAATPLQSFMVVMGAIVLPIFILIGLLYFTRNEKDTSAFKIAVEIFILLTIFSILPLPNVPAADGSKIWGAVLAGV